MVELAKQKKNYSCCNLALKPLLEFLIKWNVREMKPRWAPPVKTFFSGCSGLGSIFQIFPLTVNQRPETVTLLPLGLVYLFLCFLFKSFHSPFTSTILRLSTFEAKELMSLENFCFVFTYNLLLWRSIVTCNRCNLTLSPLINVWPTLTKLFAKWASAEG